MKTELFECVLTPSGWKLNYFNLCWHQVDINWTIFYLCWDQVDENWTIWTCADTKWMKSELFEPVLTPSGWKVNYFNLCWHQVDENWTILPCADTKCMKTELFEPVLPPSGWKLNYFTVLTPSGWKLDYFFYLCWHQVEEKWTIWTCADTKWIMTELFEPLLTPSGVKLNYSNLLTPSGWKLNYLNVCWHQVDINWTIFYLWWHQVDENWTIWMCADTKWMKTELF